MIQRVWLTTWAKFGCRINLGMADYRATIVAALRAEGHCVYSESAQDSDPVTESEIKAEVTAVRQEKYQQYCEAVAGTENPDDREYQALQERRAKTEDELLKQRKGQLSRRYEVEITADLVKRDDDGWCLKLRLHYYLTLGREFVAARDLTVTESQRERGEGALWKPDFNRSQWAAKVRLMEVLGIPELFDPHLEVSNQEPIVQQIAQLAKQNAWVIKALLGCTISPKDTPIAIAQLLLSQCDLHLEYLGRFGNRDDRQRFYGGPIITDERFEIFQRWLERDQLASEAVSAHQAVSTPPNTAISASICYS